VCGDWKTHRKCRGVHDNDRAQRPPGRMLPAKAELPALPGVWSDLSGRLIVSPLSHFENLVRSVWPIMRLPPLYKPICVKVKPQNLYVDSLPRRNKTQRFVHMSSCPICIVDVLLFHPKLVAGGFAILPRCVGFRENALELLQWHSGFELCKSRGVGLPYVFQFTLEWSSRAALEQKYRERK